MRLFEKVALVTGAARGIGARIATLFSEEGARVVIGDIRETEGRAIAEGIRATGRDAIFLPMDVGKAEDWARAVEAIFARFGKLDILVNNAGIATRAGLEDISLSQWNETMRVNAKGSYLGIRSSGPPMIRGGGGSIINMSSIAAFVGGEASPAYRASKGALWALTKDMALKYAKRHLRVNSIHPGDVISPINKSYLSNPHHLAERLSLVPLGRLGTPEDVAYLAVYLASDESTYVTGTEIIIDGGRTIQ